MYAHNFGSSAPNCMIPVYHVFVTQDKGYMKENFNKTGRFIFSSLVRVSILFVETGDVYKY